MRLFPLLLLLSACATAPPGTPEARCAQQADNEPAIVDMYLRTNGIYMWSQYDQAELKALRHEGQMKCLQMLGIGPPGGVQAVRRYE